jgi:long-chain acyl-CoA synthetase
VVYPGSRNPNRLLATARDERVTRVNVVPAVLRMMTAEIREAADGGSILDELRSRLTSITCGGAAATPALIEAVAAAGLPLWLGYGLTEAAPIVALGRAADLPRGATGRPLSGVEVRTEPPGPEGGEILVRGPNVMLGYLGDPDATGAALRDGWLHTGDLGRLDDGGHLFIVGRRKDIIVTAAGENIAPEEIEACYLSSRFAEVCAVGLPDPRRGGGERPHLAVVPAPGGDDASLRAEFVRLSAVASRPAFGMTVFTAPLPRTRNLKIRRDLVRQAVLEREGAPT